MDAAAVDLTREISQLEQQLHAQVAAEKKLKEKNVRSVELLKGFLKEQVQGLISNNLFRKLCMRNKPRLFQSWPFKVSVFVT